MDEWDKTKNCQYMLDFLEVEILTPKGHMVLFEFWSRSHFLDL